MLIIASLLFGLFTGAICSTVFVFAYKHKPVPKGIGITALGCLLSTPFIPAMASLVFADGGWMQIFKSVVINASASTVALVIALAIALVLHGYLKERRLI